MKFRSQSKFGGMLILFSLILLSNSNFFPTARTGAPGESTCASCHANNGSFTGQINLTGIPSSANGMDVLTIETEVEVLTGSPMRAGFSMVALEDSGNTNAGEWLSGDGGFSSATVSGGLREYWGHAPAEFFGGGSTVSWEADWEAPNITDDVTFYVCALLGNGSGTAGDRVECMSETISITAMSSAVELEIINETSVTCPGGSDGSAEAVATVGTPPYDFMWDNGEDTAIAINLDAGNHTVTVTDDVGNTAEATVFIEEPDVIDANEEVIDVTCFGEDDGVLDLQPSGGTGNLDCDWDFLGGGCFQDNLEPDTYTVTITDGNGCTEVFSFDIEEPEELEVDMSSTDASAPGATDGTATAIPFGGNSGYVYSWSTGNTTQTITGLGIGTYTVTVTDDNNCTVVGSVAVAGGPCTLAASPMISQVLCFGESSGMIGLAVSGGVQPLIYTWSNGTSASNLLNVPAGSYNVTVSDAAGCQTMLSGLTITQPDSLDMILTGLQDATCSDSGDGSIMVNVTGGVGDYVMNWSNGAQNDTMIMGMDTIVNLPDTLTGLNPGLYTYTLSDANGCVRNGFYQISSSDIIPPTLLLQQAVVELDASGNAPPATFDMVDAGSTDNCAISNISFTTPAFTCSDIGIQTYTVFATDANGNTSSAQAMLQVIETIPPVINCSGSSVSVSSCDAITYPLPTATDNCDVPVLTIVSGQQSGTIFPVGVSTVVYQATDACGNSSTCDFTVIVTNTLQASVTTTPATCGSSTGSLSINPSGGTPPYSTAPFGEFTSNLSAGNYVITVTDSGGCSVVETATITQSDGPVLNVTTTPAGCEGESMGTISLGLSGGLSPYTISINNGPEMSIPPSMLTGFSEGTYDLLVTDHNGCTTSATAEIVTRSSPSVDLPNIQLACAGDEVFVDFSDQYPDYSFDLFPATVGTGTYMVVVTDLASDCTSSATFEILEPVEIGVALVQSNNNDPCTFLLSDIQVEPVGGTPPYDIDILLVGPDIQGPYQILITDAMQCTYTEEVTLSSIEPIEEIEIFDVVPVSIDCDGATIIDVSVSGGCPPYSYNQDITEPLAANFEYFLVVTDNNGATATTTIVIPEYQTVELANAVVENITSGSTGGVDVELTGGFGNNQYEWIDAAGNILSTEEDLTGVSDPQMVFLRVIDVNGCVETFEFEIQLESATFDLDVDNRMASLFPNPTDADITILFHGRLPLSVDVIDTKGRVLQSLAAETERVKMNSKEFAPGIYLLRLEYPEKTVLKRFTKI